jgi:hypothetical protein
MTRMSLDTSRLPKDALTYTDEQFFKLIQSFCGKDGSDLLSIQAIRSVDSFLSIQDIYSIFELDSDDVQEIQKRCGFRKRNGTYTVKPGIKSSLDYVNALLKQMKKKIGKTKTIQSASTQSTASLSSSSGPDISSNVNTTVTSFVSKKNEAEHRALMEKSIQEWCIKNANIINIADFNPISGVHYDLQFSPSLDKVEIRCLCGLSFTLLLCNSGNFKVKHLLEHLLYRKMFLSSR